MFFSFPASYITLKIVSRQENLPTVVLQAQGLQNQPKRSRYYRQYKPLKRLPVSASMHGKQNVLFVKALQELGK
jgi:hypothetical protein